MTIGLFVEGQSDRTTIPKIIQKIFHSQGLHQRIVPRLAPRGDLFSARKMKGYLDALLDQYPDVYKIVVCVDSECSNPNDIRPHITQVENQLNNIGFQVTLQYVLVVHSLESWLLSDPDAVLQVVGHGIDLDISNPENLCKPSEFLIGAFDRCGKDYEKTIHNPLIAEHADPSKIAQRSESFRRLQQTVLDA